MKSRTGRFPVNRRTRTILTLILIFAFLFGIYLAGTIMSDELIQADFSQKGLKPSWEHPFGTDLLGRDMLVRTIKGLSISIVVGTVASSVSAVIALLVGVAAATGSSRLDHFINWLIDLVMGIPHTVLLILISFACGKGLRGVLIGVAVTHWTGLARLIRSEVLQIRSQQYIEVSRRLGHNSRWITIHHILPHMIPQFLIGLILMFPHAIMHESSLTFLGFGLSPEQPAIGIILSESMKYLSTGMWWLAFFPGLMLVIVVLLFDRLGENLKKIVDPYSAHE
ncbi:ABC transporter permease subunit [Lactonifactor sp. BIOML-A3]|uniref:ABC transporter permease n=1 Tax=unclassified Lactonifactor TaxID=2636670 RepID=UPI0012AF96A2|nr:MULTISPECIES: ABC transporter permease [unclassified Lactonifactor]MSA02777.1 ABC transporter permease subunit [Lactonifactor sp. BIOML-A5]MSA09129.1 ABC transporter permease subunit [Lactonifactor sp. BIOML-A4]MSA13793.1 ABC transporter permease subunit [Lactonifactor sp. BIOML-A3]MSA18126.1 ABC transporter permease subunit [Lactonifactor sp. BIOML-A2]MSA38977.1 ABC transporter permease subunit [Lactonifactor sp. BIOML-A1]